MPDTTTSPPPARIRIENPWPMIDCGRFPAKRVVGDVVEVQADVWSDGHDLLRAELLSRPAGETTWTRTELRRIDQHLDGDRWAGTFAVDRIGRWQYSIEAWVDHFATWSDELARKVAAGQEDLTSELLEGAKHLERALGRIDDPQDKRIVEHVLEQLRDDAVPTSQKEAAALDQQLIGAVRRHPDRVNAATLPAPLELIVDRRRALYSSWYEMFPRSWGGLSGVAEQLPRLKELGFDVVYLPPIHPIGHRNRKGKNNALVAGPDDPGSPWAIGSEQGGHDAIHPDLGTIEDFDALTARAKELDMDIALDFAVQCSADHPWLTEHPEWFNRRPDGTLKYAENPPKKYQDIYNVNWDSEDWQGLWNALYDAMRYWVDHGVKVFRVDNPHTKPWPFWEWLLKKITAEDPDVIFLSEAFTRRARQVGLAKAGFSQSYTYFTWQTTRWDLEKFMGELLEPTAREAMRPNLWPNTPDILHEYLVHGGPSAFTSRLVLAATLSPSYGIYSGYEHFENVPVRPGSEEYLDSEKYELKHRELDGPLLPFIQTLNEIRAANPALQQLTDITFLDTQSDGLIAYAKRARGNTIITVVNLDPHNAQEGLVHVPDHLGLPVAFMAHDLLSDERFGWHLGPNYVRLEPPYRQAHVLRIEGPR
ncbi:MAG TPA: alpha-1,4-glucan--maltose-1-phosphate maltosyltransferase [Solirubrobacteraceae bacterium]|nr:alpha-1,4-glucan--maltose-1-phosphate maltosyltransferase [Solirubrobacteraceae bacterium]